MFKLRGMLVVALLAAPCTGPTPLTVTLETSATQLNTVGGKAQLVVKLTNTGPSIPHLGLVFVSADKWYEHHAISDYGGCIVARESSAFDCGDLGAGTSALFTIVGAGTDSGTFHYELALRELVSPFDWVNDHPDGADVQTWDETVSPG